MSDPSAATKIPPGYHAATTWIISPDTARLLAFATKAFGAKELSRVGNPQGGIDHAEFQIGDTILLAFDSRPGWPPTPAFLRLFVDDADRVFRQATEAGAVPVTNVTALAFGARVGRVRDPLGNLWWIQEQFENVDQSELVHRFQEPAAIEAMSYVMTSLAEEMRRRTGR
jgi:uncharacterized glyoxalase superfamily protein PhnB